MKIAKLHLAHLLYTNFGIFTLVILTFVIDISVFVTVLPLFFVSFVTFVFVKFELVTSAFVTTYISIFVTVFLLLFASAFVTLVLFRCASIS